MSPRIATTGAARSDRSLTVWTPDEGERQAAAIQQHEVAVRAQATQVHGRVPACALAAVEARISRIARDVARRCEDRGERRRGLAMGSADEEQAERNDSGHSFEHFL